MIECQPEAGCGRSIDLRSAETVGQRGRHTQISNKARTVVRVSQTRIMQGRAKREKKPMTEEAVYVGVDVAKNILDLAVSNSKETRQFKNDQVVRECARKAGIPNLISPESGRMRGASPHRLRDAFSVHAMKLNDTGGGLRLLQEHLGHASFNTTAKYRKIAGTEHRMWYDRLWDNN